MERARACLVCLVVAACGRIDFVEHDASGPPGLAALPDGVTSGTRLRARRWVGDDGSKVFHDLYDVVLDAPCSALPLAGGVRCVPSGANTSIYFADAACSVPVALLPGSPVDCMDPKYASDADHVYRLGAELPGAFNRDTGNNCVAAGAGQRYFALGAEVTPDELVGATEVQVPVNRFTYDQWNFDDGARLLTGTVRDEQLGFACSFEADVGQPDPACGPQPVFDVVFRDTGCTQPVFGFAVEAVPDGTPFTSGGDAGAYVPCALPTYHRATGSAPLATASIFLSGPGCLSLGATPTLWGIDDGGAIARSTLALGAYEHPGGRVAATVWRGPDGSIVPLGGDSLFDRSLGTYCRPAFDTAGELRCLPSIRATGKYDEAGCGTPVTTAIRCDGGTVLDPIGGSPKAGCSQPISHVDQLTISHPVFAKTHTGCSATGLTGWEIFTGTVEVQPAGFSKLGLVID